MDKEAPLGALCISGGGIRSATFALGILQGLAEKDLLSKFDYLSTVSGGGYIGGWLTAWKHRAGGIDKIQPKLHATAEAPTAGPDPIQHLREYNNYLSPKLGLFSSDTWTLVATVARNMLLNWLILVPFLLVHPKTEANNKNRASDTESCLILVYNVVEPLPIERKHPRIGRLGFVGKPVSQSRRPQTFPGSRQRSLSA